MDRRRGWMCEGAIIDRGGFQGLHGGVSENAEEASAVASDDEEGGESGSMDEDEGSEDGEGFYDSPDDGGDEGDFVRGVLSGGRHYLDHSCFSGKGVTLNERTNTSDGNILHGNEPEHAFVGTEPAASRYAEHWPVNQQAIGGVDTYSSFVSTPTMPRGWTTDAQLTFLDARVIRFQAAKSEGTHEKEAFFNQIYNEFLVKWSLDTITFPHKIGTATSTDEEIQDMRAALFKARLVDWYGNHVRTAGAKKASCKLNLMQPQPRRPQAINAYATLFAAERGLDDQIEAHFNAYMASRDEDDDKKTRLLLRDECLRALLAKEDQSVKNAVDTYRSREPRGPWLQGVPEDATEDEKELARLLYLHSSYR
ncbi:hypothetical protein SISSUDRAFT_1105897 [Sistotremastrum suecicum HHB10207 ss-3]|uniref:Uncharacterized protein n=1 Tax=Sistotremastrum suecicum HHB10207 ss-3 TaxID=1314776 RepID=A0A165WIH2_9AGAM|nr:hypothetical protein SISSUDRAFT_1105897 [Sistotremastrum suecicum HHB10207 ss-3]